MITRQDLERNANSVGIKFKPDISDDDLAYQIRERQIEIAENRNKTVKTGTKTAAKRGAKSQAKKPKAPVTGKGATDGGIVTVVGPKQGRRRIGRRFGPEPVEIPVDDLSPDEIATLKNDPALAVSIP